MRARAGIVRVAGWERFPWLRAGFATRLGGVSSVYGEGELNLGWTDSDDVANVAANRARLVSEVAPGMELVTVRQVHGTAIQLIEPAHGALSKPDGKAMLEGDGLMTAVPGLLLGVQTADCVPVLLADTKQRVVGAFHAGWRGTTAGIAGHGVELMRSRYGSRAEHMVAAVGPSIGPCCFEVGDDVRAEFAESLHRGRSVDLWKTNRRQLETAGVPDVTVVGECSACSRVEGRRKYFSHRAEKGFTGRMMGVVGIEKT